MNQPNSHSSRSNGAWAATLAALLTLGGCAGWRGEQFDLGDLRDDRAREIDSRLAKAKPAVENPFGAADDSEE